MKLKKVKTGIVNFFCNKDTVSNLYWKTSILADYKYETFFSESFRRTKYKALFHPITQYRLFSKLQQFRGSHFYKVKFEILLKSYNTPPIRMLQIVE